MIPFQPGLHERGGTYEKNSAYFLSLVLLPLGCKLFSDKSPARMTAARPVSMTKAEAVVSIGATEKDRTETKEWLRSNPRSYLAAF
jgi:hypothetical protein